MAKETLKNVVVGFKVDSELFEFLNLLPNKSEFIRSVILEELGMNCPLCFGTGNVARGIGEHYLPIIQLNNEVICLKCGANECIPYDVQE
ncbi:MAG: hypothetical protein U0798_19445 [Gemmataceae bacterium]